MKNDIRPRTMSGRDLLRWCLWILAAIAVAAAVCSAVMVGKALQDSRDADHALHEAWKHMPPCPSYYPPGEWKVQQPVPLVGAYALEFDSLTFFDAVACTLTAIQVHGCDAPVRCLYLAADSVRRQHCAR